LIQRSMSGLDTRNWRLTATLLPWSRCCSSGRLPEETPQHQKIR